MRSAFGMSIPSRPQNHVSKRFESKVRATSISVVVVVGGGVAILFPTFISTKERRASLGGEGGAFCKVSGSKVNECVDDHFLSPTRNQYNMWFAGAVFRYLFQQSPLVSGVRGDHTNPSVSWLINPPYPQVITPASCMSVQIIVTASISSGHRVCVQVVASVARKTSLFLLYIYSVQRRDG